MNDKAFKNAEMLSEMSDDLVSEAAYASRSKCGAVRRIAAAAAALALVMGLVITLPKLMKHDGGEVTALIPTEGSKQDEAMNEPLPTQTYAENVTTAPVTQAPATEEPAPEELRFGTVPAVAMAVRTGMHADNNPLAGLTAIYMPTLVPYGAKLEDIAITSEEVTVSYRITEEYIHSKDDPNRFVFIWHRDWQSGDLERYGRLHHGDTTVADDVWVIITFGGLENYGVWEKDGNGFELIVPGYYCNVSDIVGFTGVTEVLLSEVDEHSPAEGFLREGYMWLWELDYGVVPVTAFAYGRTYYAPEGRMIETSGTEFISGITDVIKQFPSIGGFFETVLTEGTEIAKINVYDINTLEPLAMDIGIDELRYMAMHPSQYIVGSCAGFMLVDIIVEHRTGYIAELGEYELEAYHCGFIIECGY